jgi:hypothetical protein
MIVVCINDNWEDCPVPIRPKKGELYEVIDLLYSETKTDKNPYYVLREISWTRRIGWTHVNFREVDIDIDEIEEIVRETVPVLI